MPIGRRFPTDFDLDTATDDDVVFAFDATTGLNKKFGVGDLRGLQGLPGDPGPPGAAGGVYLQEYPPNAGTGERWIIPSLGHIAVWSGTEWIPETPTADVNLCCILGDAVAIWDAESGGATNHGTGGSALDGTIGGGMTVVADGDGYDAWQFDGVDDRISVPDNALLDIDTADDFTVAAIITLTTAKDNAVIIGKRASSAATALGWQLRFLSAANNDRPVFYVGDGTNGNGPNVLDVTVGTRHLVTGSRDTTLDTIGVAVDTTQGSITDPTTGSPANTVAVGIGIIGTSAPTAWVGYGYSYLIWRRVLTPDERMVLNAWKAARWS